MHPLATGDLTGAATIPATPAAGPRDRLRRAGLPGPEVTVHVTGAITRRPDTGKARRFIPIENLIRLEDVMPASAQAPDSRPNGAPAYYLGRPACLWITATTAGRRATSRAPDRDAQHAVQAGHQRRAAAQWAARTRWATGAGPLIIADPPAGTSPYRETPPPAGDEPWPRTTAGEKDIWKERDEPHVDAGPRRSPSQQEGQPAAGPAPGPTAGPTVPTLGAYMSPRRRDAKMTGARGRRRYDAIVVGARVAGAATAMLLARRGFDVLLVDRARFPSEIPHGHYIRLHGPPRLAAWGLLDRVLATGCPPITSITMDLGDFPLTGRGLVVDGVPVGVAPRRAALDKVLIDAAVEAGAEFRDRFPVHDLTVDDDRVTGIRGRSGLTEHARIVIGADGRNSRVAKRVSAPAYAEQPTLACWYFSYWSGVAREGLEMYRRGHRMIFAHPTNDDLLAVFVGWPIAELPAVRSDIQAQMMAVVDHVPDLSQRIRSGRREERIYGAAQLPNFLRKPHGPGWALVGDAGSHKDPARALGICDALRDAELLADALTASLPGGPAEAEALSAYERRRNEATMDDYQANLRAARFSPPAPEILQARAAARDDPHAMAQFCLAWEGRIPRRTSAAGQYEPPRA